MVDDEAGPPSTDAGSTRTIPRRRVLTAAAAAGAAALSGRAISVDAQPSQPKTPVAFDVPPDACDCHTHVFGDPTRFPFAPARRYTPEPASVAELRTLHRTLRIGRVVIVQPSVYGTDNACTLDAIRQLGPGARGVAVIDEATSASALADMQRAGIRGIRLNLETSGETDPAVARRRFERAVEQIHGLDWHIQLYTRPAVIEGLRELIMEAPVRVVFDHFAGAQAASGPGQPGVAALLALVRAGKAYVKLSAPYLVSKQSPDYPDVAPLARTLVAANPERMLWATNWPHPNSSPGAGRTATDVTPLFGVDDGRILNQLAAWIPDAGVRRAVLVTNPATLYGF